MRGKLCSQIVADVGLRHVGTASEEVLRTFGELVGAKERMEATCGALRASTYFIAFAAHGRVDPDRNYMVIQELGDRFDKELLAQYPGNRRDDLLKSDPKRCRLHVSARDHRCRPGRTGTLGERGPRIHGCPVNVPSRNPDRRAE